MFRRRHLPANDKRIQLTVKAIAGLLVDTTKSKGDDVRVYLCISCKQNVELQWISSPSNPLKLAASEKRWGRNGRARRRHVAVWPESQDNSCFVDANVCGVIELHVFLIEGYDPIRQPEWMGSCRWSPSVTKKTMDLALSPVRTSRHDQPTFSIDRKGGAMLRVEIACEEFSRPTLNEVSRPLSLSTNLSPTQKEIVDAHAAIRKTQKDGQSAKVRFGRIQFLKSWRERRDKKNRHLYQKRSWWRRLALQSQMILHDGYHRGNDDTKRDGGDHETAVISNDQAVEYTAATKGLTSMKESFPTIRPLSPWDPFGIIDVMNTVDRDGAKGSQSATPKSDSVVAAPVTIIPTLVEEDDTLCYSPTSESEYLMYRNTLLLPKPMLIEEDAPDPDLVIISDDDTNVEFYDPNDQEIEMIFEEDADVVVSSPPSDSPNGLAQLFNCWDSHLNLEQTLKGVRDNNEANTIVLDSYPADNSVEDTPLPTQSTRQFVPIEQSDEILAGTTPPLIPKPKTHRKAKRILQKWAVIDSLSENITDLLRCGPSLIEKKQMRQKKMKENDANLLGMFVKRNIEDDPSQYISQIRSPSSVTMSDVVQ
ncbi:hypothetical protein FisN_27Hh091 [Fistulifera solaris]|uniref:Uncharacterized protein n=1 Tax=Fistulifera solaris TaxID=1519565 RepID=A0A1Z5KPQ9_FISSO|nr:hypothetical protein FisN_27Hh091 [Fistulifera solaris]|eukprot:GAX28259.1 hypothetical protein FisN_27Hh091 [Fistulifera solaris]